MKFTRKDVISSGARPADFISSDVRASQIEQAAASLGQWVNSIRWVNHHRCNDFKALPRKLGQLGQSLGHL